MGRGVGAVLRGEGRWRGVSLVWGAVLFSLETTVEKRGDGCREGTGGDQKGLGVEGSFTLGGVVL